MGHRLGKIWVFDEDLLEQALAAYQHQALAAYPAQDERIRIAVAAIRDFLHSEHAMRMVMKGTPEGPGERQSEAAVSEADSASPHR